MTPGQIRYWAGSSVIDVPVQLYPDTLPFIAHLPDRSLGRLTKLLLRPSAFQTFIAAMFWVDALADRGFEIPPLVLPFVPGSRQDRLNDSGDSLFTIKSVAEMINARNFPSVTVLDPHSEVTPALIDRCRVTHAESCIQAPEGKYRAVISPDAGAEKRASAVARKLGVPLLHAWKTRDVKTGAISGFGVEEFPLALGDSPRVLVVDDICDGGGTFIGLAGACNDVTAGSVELHLFVTHGLFSKGVAPLKEPYSHIYCTDSILRDRPGVIEINICEKL